MKHFQPLFFSACIALTLSACDGDSLIIDFGSKSDKDSNAAQDTKTEPKADPKHEPKTDVKHETAKAPEPSYEAKRETVKAPEPNIEREPKEIKPETTSRTEQVQAASQASHNQAPVQTSRSSNRSTATAKNSQKMYIFGHSLIKHDHHENSYGTDRTSVPYWMALMAKSGGVNYSMSGKYGFLRNHLDYVVPHWGFRSGEVNMAWSEEDGLSFSQVGFDSIMITPANFIQYQPPTERYYDSNDTPISATLNIIDWAIARAPGATVYIYENWPDMGDSLPANASELVNYHRNTMGDVHNWWIDYFNALVAARPNVDIKFVPVGSIIAKLLTSSELSGITVDDLYEDSAPHGRPTIYFLAAMITYSATFGQQIPTNYRPPAPVHPLVNEHYSSIRGEIWDLLNEFNNGGSGQRIW